MVTNNHLTNAIEALMLNICLDYAINPLNLRAIKTGEPINLYGLCQQVYDHLTNKARYVAIYINLDEPTILMEDFTSHQQLLTDYQIDPNEPTDLILKTIEVTMYGIDYTFELITDI